MEGWAVRPRRHLCPPDVGSLAGFVQDEFRICVIIIGLYVWVIELCSDARDGESCQCGRHIPCFGYFLT